MNDKTFGSKEATQPVAEQVSENRRPSRARSEESDEAILARFGKKQQLRRGFRSMSALGLTCGLMLTWTVLLMTLQFGLQNGGPAGLFYGYIIAWIGAFLQALVMAELSSMIPISGGPFNWVAILTPPAYRKFLSYTTGWLSVMAYQAIVANTCYINGTILQGILILNYPGYEPQRWHGTMFYIAILIFALVINTYLGRILPWVESFTLISYILGFFAIIIPLVYLAPHKSAHEVFTTWQNVGGWSTDGLSFFVGFITTMGSFLGLDGADHIAEECQNANRVIPKAMLTSIGMNGALGFAMLLAVLFCMGDPADTVFSKTGYSFIDIMVYGTGSISGGTAMASIVCAIGILSATAVLATASRMLWAFSRENGVPGSQYISRIDRHTRLPLYSIGASVMINVLLACINIGSSTAFQAFVSLLVASYYSSILIASVVMLIRRVQPSAVHLPWGPFRLGRAGVPITVLAILYTVVGTFFSFWPWSPDIDAASMNYSSLLYGAALLFSVVYYWLYGRKYYQGPIYEFETGGPERVD